MLIWCPNLYLNVPLWHLISLKTHTHRNQAFSPTPDQYLQGKSFPWGSICSLGTNLVLWASQTQPSQCESEGSTIDSCQVEFWGFGCRVQKGSSWCLSCCPDRLFKGSIACVAECRPCQPSHCWIFDYLSGQSLWSLEVRTARVHTNKHNQVSWLVRTVTYTPDTLVWL